jgi:hypothetical protein
MAPFIRQGLRLADTDVVLVAASVEDLDACRELMSLAVMQHGPQILRRSGHPRPEGTDEVLTAPIGDLVDGRMRILGYVELAEG